MVIQVRTQKVPVTDLDAGVIPQHRPADSPVSPLPDTAPATPTTTGDGLRRAATAFGDLFHLPTTADPTPSQARLVGMCGWAAVLGLVGVLVGARAFMALFDPMPGWFEPVVIAQGVAGIACTIGAFLAVHRRELPWLLLGLATAALLSTLTLTLVAT